MPVEPQILKRRETARTRLFRVEELLLRFSNGAERIYERLCHPSHGAVLIVPMLDDDTVLLVKEYGAGVESYHLGLPKGARNVGEDRLLAANRELMEEVGYGAHHLEFLKTLTLSPGYMGHDIDVILAQNLYEQRLPGDEPEPLEVVPWSLRDLSSLVARDDFTEGRSLAALYLVRDLLAR
ncbi:MAG: ADP-ribose diphosphatase [Gammaproteobacteria bacterium BRH_c0]|nr:MAG: ADP-ribose diphosphatase [Gammaproteobacteria bacterium BRH_c0]